MSTQVGMVCVWGGRDLVPPPPHTPPRPSLITPPHHTISLPPPHLPLSPSISLPASLPHVHHPCTTMCATCAAAGRQHLSRACMHMHAYVSAVPHPPRSLLSTCTSPVPARMQAGSGCRRICVCLQLHLPRTTPHMHLHHRPQLPACPRMLACALWRSQAEGCKMAMHASYPFGPTCPLCPAALSEPEKQPDTVVRPGRSGGRWAGAEVTQPCWS